MKRKMHDDTHTTPKSSATGCRSSVTIIENKPVPMKNKKPVHKHPNAVDKFHATHHPEYESHAPAERCRRVNAHNDASPKMKDELEKRRATATPTADTIVQYTNGIQTTGWFNPRCRNCAKLEIQRKKQIKRRFEKRPRAPRIVKRKTPQPRKKMMLHKALSMVSEVVNVLCKDKPSCSKPGCSKDKGKPSEDPNLRYPSSHEPSVSSYHSFLSTDHEPMG